MIAPGKGRLRNRPTRVSAGVKGTSKDGRRKNSTAASVRSRKITDLYKMRLSSNVRILRTSFGLTQGQLAKMCGWHRTTVIRIETGERCPSWDQIGVLCQIFGVTMAAMERDISESHASMNAGTFTEFLRSSRLGANLSQDQIAEEIGISRYEYADYESGEKSPDPKMLAKIAVAFGKPITFGASQ